MQGTFGFEQARIDPPSPSYGVAGNNAPDAELAFRWKDSRNQFGVPGLIDADWNRKTGKGTHATLSPFDVHSTLIAAGPDFRVGETDDLPSGNVDLAPTILHIFGITPQQPLDGRVLTEAMANIDVPAPKSETKTIEATREFSSGIWRESLQISRVGSTMYLDEGNGVFVPMK
jgi:arylsulfatase A-like enzyme